MDPVVVKTVSYFSVSALIVTKAPGLVIKESFLQEKKKIKRDKISKPHFDFMLVKNKRSNWYYRA